MKKTLLLLAFAGAGLTASAQNGFYLNYNIGAGLTNSNLKSLSISPNYHSLAGYTAQVSAGYQYKKWRVEAGIQHSTTGYQLKNLVFGSQFPDTVGKGSIKYRYSHFMAPVKIGYEIPLSSKFSLTPMVELVPGYNLSLTRKSDVDAVDSRKITGKDFSSMYNRFSFWTGATLRAEYKIAPRYTIFAGPEFQYMVSNFQKSQVNASQSSMHSYSLMFNIGLKMQLK